MVGKREVEGCQDKAKGILLSVDGKGVFVGVRTIGIQADRVYESIIRVGYDGPGHRSKAFDVFSPLCTFGGEQCIDGKYKVFLHRYFPHILFS